MIKSLDETHVEFCARIDKLSQQAGGIDEMSDDAMQAAIDALGEVIADMNKKVEIDNDE